MDNVILGKKLYMLYREAWARIAAAMEEVFDMPVWDDLSRDEQIAWKYVEERLHDEEKTPLYSQGNA